MSKLLRIISKVFVTLFLVASLLFLLLNLLPGDPTDLVIDPRASEAEKEMVRESMGLNDPLWLRYTYYINDLSPLGFTRSAEKLEDWSSFVEIPFGTAHACLKAPYLGVSLHSRSSVNAMIWDGLPETLVLVLTTLIFAGLIGIPLGILVARAQRGWLDQIVRGLNAFGLAVPSFVAAMFLAWSIGYLMNDIFGLPVTGSLFQYNVYTQQEELMLANLILPMLALSVRPICVSTQLMRNSMVEVLQQDYIRTARSKGLSELRILLKHALINAMVPVFGAFTGWVSALMAGAMFVEFVFGFKGIGTLLLNAIEHQDFPVVIGVTLLIAGVYVVTDELIKGFIINFNPKLAAR